jgi:hypothetical protein
MHGAAAKGVRMRDDGGVERILATGVEKSFEPSGWTVQVFDGFYVRLKGKCVRHRASLEESDLRALCVKEG